MEHSHADHRGVHSWVLGTLRGTPPGLGWRGLPRRAKLPDSSFPCPGLGAPGWVLFLRTPSASTEQRQLPGSPGWFCRVTAEEALDHCPTLEPAASAAVNCLLRPAGLVRSAHLYQPICLPGWLPVSFVTGPAVALCLSSPPNTLTQRSPVQTRLAEQGCGQARLWTDGEPACLSTIVRAESKLGGRVCGQPRG